MYSIVFYSEDLQEVEVKAAGRLAPDAIGKLAQDYGLTKGYHTYRVKRDDDFVSGHWHIVRREPYDYILKAYD